MAVFVFAESSRLYKHSWDSLLRIRHAVWCSAGRRNCCLQMILKSTGPLIRYWIVLRFRRTSIDLLVWCGLHGMEVNAEKCKCISFFRTRASVVYDYGLRDTSLERVTFIKDLGITFDQKLSFVQHTATTAAKAFALLGFLRRNTLSFEDPYALKTVFCSLVRSVLEYAVPVWAPYHSVHSERLERIQKKFLRYALRRLPWQDPVRLPPYSERCALLSMTSLSQRRTFLQRTFVYDILTNAVDCPQLLQRLNIYVPARRLRNQTMFWLPRSRTVFGENHPLFRCCEVFNAVSHLFDYHVTKSKFKCAIRDVT
ncbi:uncharacterized protein LOC129758508 [Uranotaenia lowii]|uniref:uncharacterized protein LOC129758508 n=1 Tax=Uranotaenia lowii TaxID=190385 RepID=UPI0024789F15|nr:uncharacterized protein LOC129758508 [Uranotaenia lowii]